MKWYYIVSPPKYIKYLVWPVEGLNRSVMMHTEHRAAEEYICVPILEVEGDDNRRGTESPTHTQLIQNEDTVYHVWKPPNLIQRS